MRLSRLLLILLLAAGTVAAQDPDFTLKVDVTLVSVNVGVFDAKGQPVMTLGKEDFLIYEDGEPQELRNFSAAGAPFNVLLLVDRSGSMRDKWTFVVEAMNRFMGRLRTKDRIAIAMFDSAPQMVMDWRTATATSKEEINIGGLGGGTDIYSAIWFAAHEIGARPGRKAVIVYSDGLDTYLSQASPADYKKLLAAVEDSEAAFYFIGIDTFAAGGSRILDLAKSSGGNTYFPQNLSEVGPLYERIATNLASSYSLSYSPEKPRTGEYRQVEVQPLDVRLRLTQSREGYYAR